jgi:hypothetical protein
MRWLSARQTFGLMRRVASKDSLIPVGPVADHGLVDEASIEAAAHSLCELG